MATGAQVMESVLPRKKGPKPRLPIVKFREKYVVTEDGCWQWTACTKKNGYATFSPAKAVRIAAHRWSYQYHVGPIPDGLELDHLCRNRSCVNPEHLEPVTRAENAHRSPITITTINSLKEACPQGHPYAGANLLFNGDGSRRCRTCAQERMEAVNKRRSATRSNLRKILRGEEERLYTVALRPRVLATLVSGLTPKQKSEYLWRHTDFLRPSIAQDGLIRVPDPNGSEHLIEHTHHEWGDAFKCDRHGFCWGTVHAERAYRVNSGLCYEANTGDSFHHVRMVEPLD